MHVSKPVGQCEAKKVNSSTRDQGNYPSSKLIMIPLFVVPHVMFLVILYMVLYKSVLHSAGFTSPGQGSG